jgi:hypothetical protein
MPAPPPPAYPATGQALPPTAQVFLDAGRTLTPDKSLANIGATAKQLIAGVATISTVLTGLGLFKSDSLKGPWWAYMIPIVLTALSVVLATLATAVHRASVKLAVVEDLEAFFTREIRRRARFVQWGTLCFVAALVWAGLVTAWFGARPAPSAVSPVVRAQWSGTGNAAKLTVTATVSNATAGDVATMTVTGTRAGAPVALLTDQAVVDAAGTASFDDDIADVAGLTQVQITVGGRTITTTRSVPAATPAPSASASP